MGSFLKSRDRHQMMNGWHLRYYGWPDTRRRQVTLTNQMALSQPPRVFNFLADDLELGATE
jgi:hypothetical protein